LATGFAKLFSMCANKIEKEIIIPKMPLNNILFFIKNISYIWKDLF